MSKKFRYYDLIEVSTGERVRQLLEEDELAQALEVGKYKLDATVYGTSAAIVSGVTKKPDGGFRDVLKRIKSANHRSNIETF